MSTQTALAIGRAKLSRTTAWDTRLLIVCGVFLASGASGLIYQVLWQRMLALAFGVSTYATATVLAVFMAGLALGGFVAGRYADRARSALLAYGVVEMLIGATGIVTPPAFTALQDTYRGLYLAAGPQIAPLVRFGLAFVALLAPTALMGASFPLIVKGALHRRRDGGRAIGLLYSVNTLGAVGGATVAGFYLVGAVGISESVWIAAILNVVAGGVAVLAARSEPAPDQATSGGADTVAPAATIACSPTLMRLLPAMMAVSGFCSLAYEVVWTRLLVLFLETTTYAFTVMLAAFLLGIAVGSALVTPLLRHATRGPLLFGALQGLVGVTSLGALVVLSRLDGLVGAVSADQTSLMAMVTLAVLALFPPAVLLGMSFPIAVTLYTAGTRSVGHRLGSLYAANVFGAIFGALGAGFLLVPWLGIQNTISLMSILNLGLGLVAIGTDVSSSARARIGLAAGVSVAVGALVLLAPRAYRELFQARFPGERVLWSEEGLETTVTITRDRDRGLAMYLNHHHQANTADWMVFFHRMLGHLPMLLAQRPQNVLVVGLGGGATAGATSRYQGAQVTIVELSRGVIDGAALFRDVNYAVLEQPNVRTIVDDGRNFLLVTRERFDVITADAIWPTHAGATNLYSREYYALARRALADNGVMVQWINRDLPEPEVKMLMRTFVRSFPYVSLWFDGSLLAGSNQSIDPLLPGLDAKLDWPLTKAALAQVNLRGPDDIRRLYVTDRAGVEQLVGDGPVITDDRPHLEYVLGLSANSGPRRRSG